MINTYGKMETYRKAVETFGGLNQVDIAVEEMSELTKALLKHRRAVKNENVTDEIYDNIAEEMADVSIMLEQLYVIFGNRKNVYQFIEDKTKRLAERIEEYKNEN